MVGIRLPHHAERVSPSAAGGVELVGYLDAAVGVGEAARRYLAALRSAGVPVLERDVQLPGRASSPVQAPPGPRPPPQDVAFNILCLNPEQLLPYLGGADAPPRSGRATIGIWSWEVDVVPPGWDVAARELAEVWTYSRFAARLIGEAIDAPVIGIPPPVYPATSPSSDAPELPAGFRVLVMFDYLSTLERKNPAGAIDAFCRAFEPHEDAVLIVKSVNGEHRPELRAQLQARAHGRGDVVFLDGVLSAGGRDALLAHCDCLLSLHRSEGHGMPLAEAMAAGRSVIATAYGGNTEFMDERNSYLVGWTPTRVPAGVEHYPEGASWAEPDVEHAARVLRSVREDPESARRRASRAQADVWATLSPAAVGLRMSQQLDRLAHSNRRAGRSRWRVRLRRSAGAS